MDSTPDPRFTRAPLPARLCNLDRLLHAMAAREIDGLVVTQPLNVFYLSSFNGTAHKSDEPRPYAVILSRQAPEQAIMVIADYYVATLLDQPTWIEDIRPFRAIMLGLDLPPAAEDLERFIPPAGRSLDWVERARAAYRFDMEGAVREAIADLHLDHGLIGFDDVGFGLRLHLEQAEVADAYDPLMFARAVKTEAEMPLIERATALNEAAINRTVAAWQPGMTWRELAGSYHRSAAYLGGFVRDPGGMVWGHPRGSDATVMLETGHDDGEIGAGTHVMFDCHGTLDLYCWDGGKTWVVDGAPEGAAAAHAAATQAVAEALLDAMRPGARISELQVLARETYRKAGAPDPEAALIFFHGLGLSHYDVELSQADGTSNADWALEAGMVVPLHLLYPGGADERWWLEEVVAIEADGGRPLFSWGFGALTA